MSGIGPKVLEDGTEAQEERQARLEVLVRAEQTTVDKPAGSGELLGSAVCEGALVILGQYKGRGRWGVDVQPFQFSPGLLLQTTHLLMRMALEQLGNPDPDVLPTSWETVLADLIARTEVLAKSPPPMHHRPGAIQVVSAGVPLPGAPRRGR